MGLAAGLHPELRLRHLIPGRRATVPYLRRLAFGCGRCYAPALVQSFPNHPFASSPPPSDWQHARELLHFVGRRLVWQTLISIDLANQMGLMCGRLTVDGRSMDHWMFRLGEDVADGMTPATVLLIAFRQPTGGTCPSRDSRGWTAAHLCFCGRAAAGAPDRCGGDGGDPGGDRCSCRHAAVAAVVCRSEFRLRPRPRRGNRLGVPGSWGSDHPGGRLRPPTFFRYCDELLARYRDDQRVMHIAGSIYRRAPESRRRPATSFLNSTHPGGGRPGGGPGSGSTSP